MNLDLPPPTRWATLLLGVMLGVAGPQIGRAADWQALTGNSPFGASTANAPAAAPDDLEFRGVVQEEGVYLINLFNPTTKTSQWIPVKGKAPGLEVRSYDAGTDKVQITQGSRALSLSLKQARVTLIQPVAAPVAANPENPGDANRADRGGEGRGGRPGNGGDPAAMARNLPPEAQAMIQEFRRRRAERANPAQTQAAPRERQQP